MADKPLTPQEIWSNNAANAEQPQSSTPAAESTPLSPTDLWGTPAPATNVSAKPDAPNATDAPLSAADIWSPKPTEERPGTRPPEQQPHDIVSLFQGGKVSDNPDASYISKAWSAVNLPIVDEQRVQNWMQEYGGVDPKSIPGWTKGLIDLGVGLTSPLSIALTFGTFGTGSFLESGAAALLKSPAIGMSAEEIGTVVKGSTILSKAIKEGKTVAQATVAMTDAGLDAATVFKGLNAVKQAGIPVESIARAGIVHRVAASALRPYMENIASSEKMAQFLQTAVNGGLTYQTAYGAVMNSPRLLDAIQDGDYDTAGRLAVNIVGMGGMAALGVREFRHEAGSLMDDLRAKTGLRVKPSEETNLLTRIFGNVQREQTTVGRSNELRAQELREKYPDASKEDLHRTMKWIQSGGSESEMARRYNMLAEAGGSDKRIADPNEAVQPGDDNLSIQLEKCINCQPMIPQGSPHVGVGSITYRAMNDLPVIDQPVVSADPRAKQIADWYADAQHEPNKPEVADSYRSLIDQIQKQYKFATEELGIKIEPYAGEGQPYPNSAEMMADVKENKHLSYFTGGTLPQDHPLAAIDPGTGHPYNHLFRAIHDLFGHASEGFEFGQNGEENAYMRHRAMFTKDAWPALFNETKAQNSWVNSGKHLRDAHGNIPRKGEEGFVPAKDRPYADNKAALPPKEFLYRPEELRPMSADDIVKHITSGRSFAVLQAENPYNNRISDAENLQRTNALKKELTDKGYRFFEVEGHTKDVAGEKEHALFVPDMPQHVAGEFGRKYNQAGVLTRDGIRWLGDNPRTDYIQPSNNAGIVTGEQAQDAQYFTVIRGPNGEAVPFTIPLDDNLRKPAEYDPATVSLLRSPNELKKRYGLTQDIRDAGFIDSNGDMIPLRGNIHDQMIGARATDQARTQYINDHGMVRVRFRRNGVAGAEMSISVPVDGVSRAQAERIQEAALSMPYGRIILENASDGGNYKVVDNPTKNTVYDALRQLKTQPYATVMASRVARVPAGSTINLLEKPLKVEVQNKEGIAAALNDFTTRRLNALDLASHSPGQLLDRARGLGLSEIQRQLAEENSGVDWYRKDIDVMTNEFQKLHPELALLKKAGFFKSFVAAASLGNDSPSTMKNADEIYNLFKKGNKVPLEHPERGAWAGKHPNAIRGVLENIQSILRHNDNDPEKAFDWMMSKHPVSELREVRGGKEIRGAANELKYGAYALSPKAGAFFLNMNGVSDQLTMDTWATRTWNRWMGTLIDDNGQVREAPKESQRKLATMAFQQLAKEFGLSTMDAQAAMWYYEQQLWKSHGMDIDQGVSYGQASENYVRQRLQSGRTGAESEAARATGEASASGRVATKDLQDQGAIPSHDLSGDEEGDTSFDTGVYAARTAEGRIKLGADVESLGKILGSSLYKGRAAAVITKELVQNAMDAVRLSSGAKEVHVDLGTHWQLGDNGMTDYNLPMENIITVRDTGKGLTKNELGTVFTDLGSSGKRDQTDASGGFGLAKAAPLMMSKKLEVTSIVREPDGKYYKHTFVSTPEGLLGSGVDIKTEPMPSSFLSKPATGVTVRSFLPHNESIWDAYNYVSGSRMSINSPGKLFFTQNDRPIEGETLPPKINMTPIASGKTNGAEFKFYKSEERDPIAKNYGAVSVEVHNNGIFQFQTTIFDDRVSGLKDVPTRVAVDMHATVPEGDANYPFTANRESLRTEEEKEIADVVKKQIIDPAFKASQNEIVKAYNNVPMMKGTEIPVLDTGSRFKPEELRFMQSHPAMMDLAKAVHSAVSKAVDHINESGLLENLSPDFGKKIKRVGLVFSPDVRGVYITGAPDHATVFIEPFNEMSNDPHEMAESVFHTIAHELTHDAVKGHNEKFTSLESLLFKALGQKGFANKVRTELYNAYADPTDGTRIRTDLDRPLSVYRERSARPASSQDFLSGETLSSGNATGQDNSGDNVDRLRNSGEGVVRGTSEQRIADLIKKQHVKEAYKGEELNKLLDSYDYRKMTPRHKELAKELRSWFNENEESAIHEGVLNEGIADYVSQFWKKSNTPNAPQNEMIQAAKEGQFSNNSIMARHRVLEHAFVGELLGKKLAITDPITLAANNGNSFGRAAAVRHALADIMNKNVRASDGRPLVAMSGHSHIAEGQDGENDAVLAVPRAARSIRIADKVIQGMSKEDVQRLLDEKKMIKWSDKNGNEGYSWNTHDYGVIDHGSMRNWTHIGVDTSGNPVQLLSDARVHPEAFEYLKRQISPEQSDLSKVINPALKLGKEAKGFLLFGSPFHLFQEGLRAFMTGVSPFGVDKWDLSKDELAGKLVGAGMTLKDYRDIAAFQESRMAGHSKIIEKIPGASQYQAWLENFLFDQYIPSLKVRAGKSLVAKYAKAYPNWSEGKVLEQAAKDTNERFGGINYKLEGRKVVSQDLLRLVALAPDWLESELRFMSRTFGEEGKVARADVTKMAIGLYGVARVLNYLTTGHPHNEAPFGVAYKDKDGKEKIYSIRTMPTDMLHAMTDPAGFLKGRTAPLLKTGIEAYTGRDEHGRKLPEHHAIWDLASNAAPIPAVNIGKQVRGESPDTNWTDQMVKASGGTVNVYRTEAMKKASELAADHNESGPVDPVKMRRHQTMIKYEDDLRSGEMTMQDLSKLYDSGQIDRKEATDIKKNLEQTREMPADMASLYIRASRLSAPEFLQVWDLSTNEEKAKLSKLLIKKRVAYFKKANTEMSNEERANDPTYKRLRQMFPQETPF